MAPLDESLYSLYSNICIICFFIFRAVLAEKFKGYSGESEVMTIGKMLHQVFQQVLMKIQEVGASLRGVALKDAVSKEIQSVVSTLDSLDQL